MPYLTQWRYGPCWALASSTNHLQTKRACARRLRSLPLSCRMFFSEPFNHVFNTCPAFVYLQVSSLWSGFRSRCPRHRARAILISAKIGSVPHTASFVRMDVVVSCKFFSCSSHSTGGISAEHWSILYSLLWYDLIFLGDFHCTL